ncbi:type IV toxin-antitoxin system AbiEi family antitoxin domain-containing protein [Nocardioides currus]|uniref:AbiEi antitoxin N-terminal domain-containing protein n=1 Tax=Nocardioides currus TaxID=2133958 RepID=A0A2R7YTY3_9ACTN|nr:type IV toxin-antitoxin system AbiEi family antitoxin domain-containing protein [Nocardioides currus]PUA79773.1 hypothetical protein C7S10_16970 [Nocardioides currus]
MDLTSYLPAVAQHGIITHPQALAAGLSARDIARLVVAGDWVRLRRSAYVDGDSYRALDPFREAPLLRIRAASLTMPRPVVFSHDSAAIILGLGVPDARASAIHVSRPERRATITSAGVVKHGALFRPDQVLEVSGLRVLDAARTALDMTRLHGLWPRMAACDAALRLGVTHADLEGAARPMVGWPFKHRVDRAVALADDGAETYLESLGRGLVHDLGVGHPQTQFGISDGTRTIWGDIRVGRHLFETDGKLKYFLEQQDMTPHHVLWEEKLRQDFIAGFKLGVSRITMHDCLAGRPAALRRLAREYAGTVARFGTDISDLAPYVVTSPRVTPRNLHSRHH